MTLSVEGNDHVHLRCELFACEGVLSAPPRSLEPAVVHEGHGGLVYVDDALAFQQQGNHDLGVLLPQHH